MKRKIAFFDFDGTLTTKDSFVRFFKYWKGNSFFLFNCFLLLPQLLSYSFGFISAHRLKEIFLHRFLKNVKQETILEKGKLFSEKIIPQMMREEQFDRLEKFQQEGYSIVIVSASLDIWLEPWCTSKKIDCICTRVEFKNGKATGKLATPNCNEKEKVRRIKNKYDLSNYSEIIVCGNSKKDVPMMELATSEEHVFWVE